MQIMGSLAVVATTYPIASYLLFPDLRRLRYCELVFYVAINEFIASIGIALGEVPSDTVACNFQTFSTSAEIVSAGFWTTVISYQLYLAVYNNAVIQDLFPFHIFCWMFPVLVTLLPLSTSTYANPDDEGNYNDQPHRLCFYSSGRYQLLWDIIGFYLWEWLSIITMMAFLLSVAFKLRTGPATQQNPLIATSLRKLMWYPLIHILCWIMPAVYDLISAGSGYQIEGSGKEALILVTNIIAAFQPMLSLVVYIYANPIVRQHWAALFASKYGEISAWWRPKADEAAIIAWRDSLASCAINVEAEPDYIAPRDSSMFSRPSQRMTTVVNLFDFYIGRLNGPQKSSNSDRSPQEVALTPFPNQENPSFQGRSIINSKF
jgi:hypothetical protein